MNQASQHHIISFVNLFSILTKSPNTIMFGLQNKFARHFFSIRRFQKRWGKNTLRNRRFITKSFRRKLRVWMRWKWYGYVWKDGENILRIRRSIPKSSRRKLRVWMRWNSYGYVWRCRDFCEKFSSRRWFWRELNQIWHQALGQDWLWGSW